MNYKCTRNQNSQVTAAQAIVQGIAKDGGLFVPETLPQYTHKDFVEMQNGTYIDRAVKVLSDFLPEFTKEEIKECVSAAYAEEKFSGGNPAPISVVHSDKADMNILELWHGPTCAFKDMALQLLPHLLTHSLKITKCDKTAVILVATSGDTGKAALEGFKDVDRTKMLVFYPENGVSPMQKRQMNTQEGNNVSVCAIEGNFDDAQTGVKKMFGDKELAAQMDKAGYQFSSANSINIGRLVPQVVYYVYAYAKMYANGEVAKGEKINVVVPTGNFGNILAAYYAKNMGVPIDKLICASNDNKVLYDFFRTGTYDRNREFILTTSPSMDILISSNLERLIYKIAGADAAKDVTLMQNLAAEGKYEITDEMKAQLKDFYGNYASEKETAEEIAEVYKKTGYIMDTHTAVASRVYRKYVAESGDQTKTVIASTASPYKFTRSVMDAIDAEKYKGMGDFELVDALSELSGVKVPQAIEEIRTAPVLHKNVVETEDMPKIVKQFLNI